LRFGEKIITLLINFFFDKNLRRKYQMNDLDVFAQEMESLIVADSKIYRNLFKSMMGKFLV
jgi:hypothetical protein